MLDIHRLNEFIKIKKLTNIALSKKLEDYGIRKSNTAIQKYRTGINDPDTKTLSILADILDVTEQDFFVGAKKRREKIAMEEIRENPLKYKHMYNKENLTSELKQVRLQNSQQDYIYIDKQCLNRNYVNEDIFGLIINGDSMQPYLSAGDIALYKLLNKNEVREDGKYIIETPIGLQAKNLKFLLDGSIKIISQDKTYHLEDNYDEKILKDKTELLKIVGCVVGRVMKW